MALYVCKLGASDGRILQKELEAATPAALRQNLEEQGYFVFDIRKKPFQFLWEKGIARKKIDSRQLLTFNQELLVLLKAGIPIVQVLDTILEHMEHGKLSEILRDVREDIKGGTALSAALEKFPRAFSHLYVASIRAGERTGDLPQTLRRFIAFQKRAEGLRKKFISALIYPSILVTVAVLAITLLLVYVVPTFSKVYADSGSQLPGPTLVLIACTSFMRTYFWLFLVLLIGGAGMFRTWAATPSGRYQVDRMILRTPFIGAVATKYSVAGFTRTLATVIGSGIPIVESLKMSLGTLNNVILERKLLHAVGRVEEGTSLSVAIESVHIMPPLALRMLAVGESTGALEEMLGDISEYFEEEIDKTLHVITTAVEPAIMLVMGLVIGVIIITMYLPIFKIAGTVGG